MTRTLKHVLAWILRFVEPELAEYRRQSKAENRRNQREKKEAIRAAESEVALAHNERNEALAAAEECQILIEELQIQVDALSREKSQLEVEAESLQNTILLYEKSATLMSEIIERDIAIRRSEKFAAQAEAELSSRGLLNGPYQPERHSGQRSDSAPVA